MSDDARAKFLERTHIPSRFRARLRVDLVPEALRGWVGQGLALLDEGGGALLVGQPGGGKTAALCWSAIELRRQAGRAGWPGLSALYITCAAFVDAVMRRERDLVRRAERTKLLLLDDLGAEYGGEWGAAALDALIDRRWSELRATICASNVIPDGDASDTIERRYPRIYSRLTDAAGPGVIVVDRKDLRRG